MRKILVSFILILSFLFSTIVVFADYDEYPEPEPSFPLNATAAILVEQTTGQVLFGYNEHERRYPASMSKMLTALVVLDHLNPDDIIIIGPEINDMPHGYASLVHVEGEALTVRVLLKALMIRSGNESGRTLALNVIRRTQNNPDISYEAAKPLFSALMNERAQELGAYNSNFDNPYGLHSAQHFTTAYDLALIARAYMEVPLLAQIAAMYTFEGSGTGGRYVPETQIRDFEWTNTNQTLPEGPLGYAHMTGIKTGFTTPAGECLAGAASFGDLALISIVFDSESPGRWHDTRRLMDYGFFNYTFRQIARAGDLVEYVRITNPRRGEQDMMAVFVQESYRALISHAQYYSLTRVVTYNIMLTPPPVRRGEDEEYEEEYDDGLTRLMAPIEEGEFIGTIAYYAGEERIFESRLYASATMLERSFDSDMDYFISQFTDNMFTLRGLPYWLAIIGTVLGFVGMGWALSLRRKLKEHDRWHRPRTRNGGPSPRR